MQLGGFFSKRIQHPKKWMVRLALFLLSTCIGTFILCGRASLSSKFPYFQRFSQVSRQKREEIVISWSLSFFYKLRMLFRAMKFVVLYVFFTQVRTRSAIIIYSSCKYINMHESFNFPDICF